MLSNALQNALSQEKVDLKASGVNTSLFVDMSGVIQAALYSAYKNKSLVQSSDLVEALDEICVALDAVK